MLLNKVLTDKDREQLAPIIQRMQQYWPEMFSRKIPDSMVQFAWTYKTARDLDPDTITKDDAKSFKILAAGSHEDIATECLKLDGDCIVGVDPVWNSDLHKFYLRRPQAEYDFVISASVLEHTTDDEEFVADCCKLLLRGGYGIFTMDFKNDWKPGQPVPYTSNRFYTTHDLTVRLPIVLAAHGCEVVGEQDYSARDRFVWDGINYSFATLVFKKVG